jgi:predicted ATPase
VTSRQVSVVGDVYSFGTLAYELVTGFTREGGPDSPIDGNIDLLSDIHQHVTDEVLSIEEALNREAHFAGHAPRPPPPQLSGIIHRCLEKDPDDRYGSLDAVAYDLNRLLQISRTGGDLSKFKDGEIDTLARLALPRAPVHREVQLGILQHAFEEVSTDSAQGPRVVNLWGVSGSGKTRVVRHFTDCLLESNSPCTVVWAKMDEFSAKPLSSFVQAFHALLDSAFTDPNQDIKRLQKDIRNALGNQFSVLLSLLTPDARKLIQVGNRAEDVKEVEAGDWANILSAFNMWSKRFLQIFAERRRPLVIVVDDIQWMEEDEVKAWRHILDGVHPLRDAMVVSTCRDILGETPAPQKLLSASSSNTEIPFLTESGVLAKVETAFHHLIEGAPALASFLFAETNGSPLYLRSLVSSLVKDKVIYFDFERVIWRYNTVDLQQHLSESGLDGFFERLLLRLPEDARELLYILSCLPSAGLSTEQLASLLERTISETQTLANTASSTAGLVSIRNNQISISHDRPRAVAFKLIPEDSAAEIHHRVSMFLRSPAALSLVNPCFGAADHALLARRYNYIEEDSVLVELLLSAGKRALRMGGFLQAKTYMDAADGTFESLLR